jgi:hypothetical protein
MGSLLRTNEKTALARLLTGNPCGQFCFEFQEPCSAFAPWRARNRYPPSQRTGRLRFCGKETTFFGVTACVCNAGVNRAAFELG